MKQFASQTLPSNFPYQQQDNYLPQCRLKWRQGQLLVRLSQDVKQPYLPSLESKQWLVECLKHSPVQLVCIDPALGEVALQRWAEACEQARKPVFLRRAIQELSRKQSKLSERVRQLIDWIVAFLLLILLSPVMLALLVLMHIYSPGPIFSRQWHVRAKGKLFRVIKFRTTEVNNDSRITAIGHWMCKYGLGKLPQLFNVLRGEMSLFGPRPLTLSEAMCSSLESQRRLNALRGSAEIQSVEVMITQLDLAGYEQ
jgi:hypothetical protein